MVCLPVREVSCAAATGSQELRLRYLVVVCGSHEPFAFGALSELLDTFGQKD